MLSIFVHIRKTYISIIYNTHTHISVYILTCVMNVLSSLTENACIFLFSVKKKQKRSYNIIRTITWVTTMLTVDGITSINIPSVKENRRPYDQSMVPMRWWLWIMKLREARIRCYMINKTTTKLCKIFLRFMTRQVQSYFRQHVIISSVSGEATTDEIDSHNLLQIYWDCTLAYIMHENVYLPKWFISPLKFTKSNQTFFL